MMDLVFKYRCIDTIATYYIYNKHIQFRITNFYCEL